MGFVEDLVQKLINTVKQVSTRTFLSLVLVFSAHIFFYIYLVQILSRLSSKASSHALLQQSGASMLSEITEDW